ncbi:MAG: PKD-like domain-containing protein [Cytophaga sp.]|uniref:PKD-like domain-containing protein n=1 Tax=Cytophaga sp. TaxID=29535 RepID=UPI003F7EE454
MISIGNGTGYLISGNYLGGQAPKCGGSLYTLTSGIYTTFKGIYFSFSSSGANTITNNTIQNISFSGSNYSSIYAFTAIYLRGNGDFTCGGGSGLGNTIGSITSSGSIKFNNPSATGGTAGFCAIRDSSSSLTTGFSKTISYNTIGGIDINTGLTGEVSDIISITNGSSKGAIIDNNTIGSTTAPITNSGIAALNVINNTFAAPFTATNNIIQGIKQTNAAAINTLTIIKSSGNTDMTCTDNTISNITSASNALVSVINYAGGSSTAVTGNFVNNTINTISLTNTGNGTALNVFDISCPGNIFLDVNTIGTTATGNITIAGNGITTLSSAFCGIILTNGSSPASITDNTIQGVTLTSTGTGNGFIGVGISGGSSIITASGNTIQNISSATSSAVEHGAIYIDNTKTGHSVYGSYISSIAFTNTTAATINTGIYLGCSGNNGGTTEKNLIIGLSNASSSTSAKVIGIEYTNTSNWAIVNNIILLDNTGGSTTTSLTGINISSYGIGQAYHNTIKLSGTQTGAAGSSCILSNSTAGTFTIKNNIFQNIRTGGSGFFYAENYPSGPTFTTNNNYLESSTPANIARKTGTDYAIATWQSTVAAASVSGTATIDASGRVTSASFAGASKGTYIAMVPTDIISTTRSTTAPWMGAFEGPGMTVLSITPASYCAGATISVPFTLTGSAYSGNVYTIELSSAAGSFASPTPLGTGLTTSPKTVTIPPATPAGTGYRIRISSSNPVLSSADNGVNLTINALPTVVAAAPAAICSGSSTSIALSSAPAGATFTWSRSAVTGITPNTGSGATSTIAETLTSTNSTATTVTYSVIPTLSGCTGTAGTITQSVTPAPTISAGPNQTVCANVANVVLSATIANASGMVWSSSGTGSFTSTTSANTNYVPSAADKSAGSVVLTATTTGTGTCSAVSNNLTVTFKPLPTVTFTTPSPICSGSTTAIALTSTPTGATFTWTRSAVAGITPNTGSGTTSTITETLTSSNTTATTVTYTVTPTANGCTGNTASISQVVNPLPVLTAATPAAICTGSSTSIALSSTPAGATFTWSRSAVTGITPNTGSGATSTIAETLTSTNSTATTVTYSVIPTLSGCTGTAGTIMQTVTPKPTMNAGLDQAVCANASGVTLTATFANATGMIWSSSGTGTFTSTTSANTNYVPSAADKSAGTVTLTATTTGSGSCSAVSDNLIITFKPLPAVTPVATTTICSGTSTTIALTSAPTGATFTWTASGTPTGYSNGSGNTISQTLVGNGVVTYVVTPTLNACTGSTYSIPVTVQVPAVTPAALSPGTLGVAYSQSFSVTVMTSPTWSLIGASPPGLSLSAGGLFSGTPQNSNSYTFNIKAAQGACSVTLPYTFAISTNSTTWNGTTWSNGAPNATTDAILDANYTTTAAETFAAYNLTVNAGSTFTLAGTASVTVNGNLINNGVINQKCTAGLTVKGTTSGNAVVVQLPVISPTVLNNGKVNTAYSQTTAFSTSFGFAPVFTASGLPSGLTIPNDGSNKISGSTLTSGTFPVIITSNDGACTVTSQPINLLILDLTNPNLQFTQQSVSTTYGNAPFSVKAVSKSSVPITYSISPATSTCALVDPNSGLVTISCVPPGNVFSVVAHQIISAQYKDATDTINIFVTKAHPVVTLYTVRGVIKNDSVLFDYKLPQGYTSETGASVTYFQSSGTTVATVDNTTGIIHGIAPGSFDVSFNLAATGNYSRLDTTFSFTVYDAAVPPTAVADTLILYRSGGVLGDGTINLLKNDYGVTSHLSINLTDIDIINPGNQDIFYSPPVGTFELDQQTGVLTVHPAKGLTGTARIGYTVTDSSGVVSNITYVTIEILNLQDLPDLKANEVMTPNLDGQNDVLFIAYTDINKNNHISIQDEAGNIIYETNNYQNDWAAKNKKGEDVEAGVYIFVFNEEDGQGRTLRGFIQVVR